MYLIKMKADIEVIIDAYDHDDAVQKVGNINQVQSIDYGLDKEVKITLDKNQKTIKLYRLTGGKYGTNMHNVIEPFFPPQLKSVL